MAAGCSSWGARSKRKSARRYLTARSSYSVDALPLPAASCGAKRCAHGAAAVRFDGSFHVDPVLGQPCISLSLALWARAEGIVLVVIAVKNKSCPAGNGVTRGAPLSIVVQSAVEGTLNLVSPILLRVEREVGELVVEALTPRNVVFQHAVPSLPSSSFRRKANLDLGQDGKTEAPAPTGWPERAVEPWHGDDSLTLRSAHDGKALPSALR